jgi:hypothetical protein
MKDKAPMYLVIALVIILVIIFFVGKSYGKNLPPKSIADPKDNADGTTNYNPTALTDSLFNDIEGISWLTYHDTDPYINLNKLSDTNIVVVMNDWDKRYYNKHKETLFEAIGNEYYLPTQIETIYAVMDRLRKLEQTRKK